MRWTVHQRGNQYSLLNIFEAQTYVDLDLVFILFYYIAITKSNIFLNIMGTNSWNLAALLEMRQWDDKAKEASIPVHDNAFYENLCRTILLRNKVWFLCLFWWIFYQSNAIVYVPYVTYIEVTYLRRCTELWGSHKQGLKKNIIMERRVLEF